MPPRPNSIHATLSALAGETRKSVVDLLSKEPRRASDIAAALSLRSKATSRHHRVLRRGGLIREDGTEADACVRIFRLRQRPFQELRQCLDEVESSWIAELASCRDHINSRRPK